MLTAVRALGLGAWLAALLLGSSLILAPDAAAQTATATPSNVDYDTDDDGLIEISTLGRLNAIRHDLNGDGVPSTPNNGVATYNNSFPNRVSAAAGRMGCPGTNGCTGYELTQDLNFDANRDGLHNSGDAYWNSGAGWVPIGTFSAQYNATFDGNGYTISFLYINRNQPDQALFAGLASGKEIRNLGVKHARVGHSNFQLLAPRVAILVGRNNGTITKSYSTGAVVGSGSNNGGLVARNEGTVRASYSTASVNHYLNPPAPQPGGGSIRSPLCEVGSGLTNGCGGLVGHNTGTITASWSSGKVDTDRPQGLASGTGTATNSYWDTQTSGRTSSTLGTGYTTRELQRPTGYTGIYSAWNLNLDGNAGMDDPWDFGTNREYPALKYAGRSVDTQRGPSRIEADHWGAPVVGEPVVAFTYDKSQRSDLLSMNNQWSAACDGGSGGWDKMLWVWERSDNGRTGWATITPSGLGECSFIYVPVTADVGKYLRACVPRWLYGNGCTHHTAPVLAASAATAATASFRSGNASPVVGTDVVVSALPTHTDRTVWRWQRCSATDGTGCTALAPVAAGGSFTYQPVAGDVGNYLRAFVYYSDSGGTWTRAATGFTAAVAAASP